MHTRGQISTLKRKLESAFIASRAGPAPTSEHDGQADEHREYIGMMGGTPCELSLTPPKEFSSENDDCAGSQAISSLDSQQ